MRAVFYVICSLFIMEASVHAAAPPNKGGATKGEDWIVPSRNFLATRLVRASDVPAKNYDVVVDVPPTPAGKLRHLKLTQSCGDSGIDAVALDYAKLIVRQVGSLAEKNETKELRFPLRLVPVPVMVHEPVLLPHILIGNGFHTPIPPYPYQARAKHHQGSGFVKVTYAHGRAIRVVVTKSTGSPILDSSTAMFALANWTDSSKAPEATQECPVTYQLQ